MGKLAEFLLALGNMVRRGDIRRVEDALRFAENQFGKVTPLLKKQIERIMSRGKNQEPGAKKEGEVIDVSFKPGKSKYSDKIIEESPSQKISRDQEDFLKRVGRQIEQDRKDLGPIDTKEEGITFSVPEEGIFNQKTSIDDITEMLTKNPFRSGGGLDLTTGMTRTAARVVLDRYGIKVPERADAIDIFEENFGGDALMDLKNVAEELVEKEQMGRITESMGEFLESRGMFDLKVDKTAPKAMSDEELAKKLTDDDPDRTNNAMGGINRTSYAFGTGIKLSPYLAKLGKDLKKEIRKAIDNFIQPSGDRKLDADVILDDMFEELNLDRDMFDQKDILDAYDEIYTTISKGPGSRPIKQGDAITSENFGDSQFAPDTRDLDKAREMSNENFDTQKILDDVYDAYGVTPKMVERFKLKEKYPGLDDELLTAIVDSNPDTKAEVLATLDQALELQKQGKTPEEAVDILKETMFKRKDNAEGGLNYLMGM